MNVLFCVMAGQGRDFTPDRPGHPRLYRTEDVDTRHCEREAALLAGHDDC